MSWWNPFSWGRPDGWTSGEEADYQANITKLDTEIGQADSGMRQAEMLMLTGADGREFYRRAKLNGWL
jgi:hypothetical protein